MSREKKIIILPEINNLVSLFSISFADSFSDRNKRGKNNYNKDKIP